MITERPVDPALKTMLVNNEPFQYAHLIKFERPSRPDTLSGLVSTSQQRYTYLTDASINVSFDDGSKNLQGDANGPQVYLANKVLSIGAIQEQIKATTSTTSLVLDGTGLGAELTWAVSIVSAGTDPVTSLPLWDITYTAPVTLDDLLAEGFREGDKVELTYTVASIEYTHKVNINSFRANNVLRVSKIDDNLVLSDSVSVQMVLSSEEIISILLDKTSQEYASFINREVYIYRGYFQEGSIVGVPTCVFRGIISGVSFEDSENSVKVNWSLSSHWSDFSQVRGRVTSDTAHRALDSNGVPQVSSALKPIYAYDKGFVHAETSIHLLAKYVTMVQGPPEVKAKKGFLGIGASVKVKQKLIPEDRFTNLDFQMQAKAIPVVYGVRKVDTIPIFADTLNNDSSEVFVAAVLSEGEIGGIYDVYIEGNSLICNDAADYDARHASSDNVELVCRGNSSNGDVLGGEQAQGAFNSFYTPNGELVSITDPRIANFLTQFKIPGYNPASVIASNTSNYGLVDGDTIRLTEPSTMSLDIFTGKAGQRASAQLCKIALEGATDTANPKTLGFKIQNSYWMGSDTYEYWGPNHRLLDTAYVVGRFTITDGDTTIPELSFIIRGKVLDCYNYDYSFLHDSNAGSIIVSAINTSSSAISLTVPLTHGLSVGQAISLSEVSNNEIAMPALNFSNKVITGITNGASTATITVASTMYGTGTYGLINTEVSDNFALGDIITLWTSPTNQINASDTIQIIDKWTFYNPDGTPNTRFRFSTPPALDYDAITGKPSIKKFYMKSSTGATWTMVSHNYNILEGTVPGSITTRVDSVASTGTSTTGSVKFIYTGDNSIIVNGDPGMDSPAFQLVTKNSSLTYDNVTGSITFPYAIMDGAVSSTVFECKYPSSAYLVEATDTLSRYTVGGVSNLYLASKNTIKLPTNSTSKNNYFKNYGIEVTRYNYLTGKSLIQAGTILSYDGATKIATIDSIWDFIPVSGDTIRIFPKYTDARVSINPAIQALDYITSKTYGRGLDPYKDLDLPSWLESARKCDSTSDVTVGSSASASNGAVYKYPATGNVLWQGTVSSGSTVGTMASRLVTFTDVIGKLTNKWTSWKTWKSDEIVYAESRVYKVTSASSANSSAAKLNAPTHTTGVVNGFTYISSLSLTRIDPVTKAVISGSLSLPTTAGNPVFSEKDGKKISGYSIYDCDDINYWKVSGWDEHAQRYATKNQCNISIDTAQSLFDNMNGLLEHFNGILRYTAGKYYLSVEEAAGDIPTNDIRTITTDDIIGKIQLTDEGTRSAFNSLTAAFADPANKFEARNVSFFNSEYLKADRNVPKKGNLSIPGITNYYNTRLLADSFLNKSRFGLTISMTIRPSGFLLLAGTIIQVVYPRYDWKSPGKKFRIESVTYQPDGMVDIVAKEYDDSFYSLSHVKKVAGTGATTVPVTTVPGSPTNLIVTSAETQDELLNGVELFWDNDPSISNSSKAYTEVYGSLSPHLFITVTSINGSTLTTSSAHGLVAGMPIYPANNWSTTISNKKKYYVFSVTPTTFTLSETKSGTSALTHAAGSGLSLSIRTAALLGTVPIPMRSYTDTVVNEGTGRVEKYYWVRHKVNRT